MAKGRDGRCNGRSVPAEYTESPTASRRSGPPGGTRPRESFGQPPKTGTAGIRAPSPVRKSSAMLRNSVAIRASPPSSARIAVRNKNRILSSAFIVIINPPSPGRTPPPSPPHNPTYVRDAGRFQLFVQSDVNGRGSVAHPRVMGRRIDAGACPPDQWNPCQLRSWAGWPSGALHRPDSKSSQRAKRASE